MESVCCGVNIFLMNKGTLAKAGLSVLPSNVPVLSVFLTLPFDVIGHAHIAVLVFSLFFFFFFFFFVFLSF